MTLLSNVLFFGGLWGLVEASLGYVLHRVPEVLFLPPMSGLILFPVGLFFMVRGSRASGNVMAVPLTALVAASIKLMSGFLPFIPFRFVGNPALAILAEGAVAWAVLSAGAWKADPWLPLKAVVLSFGWRTIFLGINIALSLPGIANKPAELQIRFVTLDGSVDALIITAAVFLAAVLRKKQENERFRSFGPIPAILSVIAGFGGQAFFLGR
jgi:hypothetical protein